VSFSKAGADGVGGCGGIAVVCRKASDLLNDCFNIAVPAQWRWDLSPFAAAEDFGPHDRWGPMYSTGAAT